MGLMLTAVALPAQAVVIYRGAPTTADAVWAVLKTAGLSASINAWRQCEVLEERAVQTHSTRLILPVRHIPRRSAGKFRSH